MNKVAFAKLLNIARDLADTGNYPNWREVVEDISFEDYPYAVRQLGKDPAVMQALDLRCEDARRKKAQS